MNSISMTALAVALISLAASTVGASAQDQGHQVSSGDVLARQVMPAPENHDIILKFGESKQIYFKDAIKAIKLNDESSVRAMPQTDHVVAFTGVSPGRSTITIESRSGVNERWGIVTVVNDLHDVRIYSQSQINKFTGEHRSDSSSAIGGYVTLSCNEITCDEMEPKLQARLPR